MRKIYLSPAQRVALENIRQTGSPECGSTTGRSITVNLLARYRQGQWELTDRGHRALDQKEK